MNDDSNRSQLNSLKSELERVEMDLRFLRVKAEQLESRIAAEERAAIPPIILTPPLVAPPLEPQPQEITPIAEPEPVYAQTISELAPAPPVITEPVFETAYAPESEPPLSAPEPPFIPAQPESFEMRLGTYWFVRIGIVMVLTAMVFLGNYAYQHYIALLGPIGKVIMMYAASATLLAAGAILPRKQERLKNYGQVLFAGGLAAVYFTTYAAHHFQNLRVITSPVLDGILLLAWTSYIVWLADRKKSEVLAVFAIGLAYYTALITNVGSFTLISNFLLAAAAVFFLVRNRWVTLTFFSVAASYGSYLYWRYYAGSTGIDEFAGRFCVSGYWAIFTAAVFLTRHELFAGRRRASFLTFNNGAAFALLTFTYVGQQSDQFWKLSLAAGAILLALSFLALKLITDDELPRRAYLAQGLLLITLGLITKLSGPTLALVLAVESALLLIFSTQWKSHLLRNASIAVSALGSLWLLFSLQPADPNAWWKCGGVFALLLFNGIWAGKNDDQEQAPNLMRPLPTYFTGLSVITWIVSTLMLGRAHEIGPILALTTVSITALHYVLRIREVTLLSQLPLAVAQGQTLMFLVGKPLDQTATPLIVILISLAAALWWRHQKVLAADENGKRFLETICAFAAAAIANVWLPQIIRGDTVITVSWILTFAATALGLVARSWPIAAAGQLFLITASCKRLFAMLDRNPETFSHSLELIGAWIVLAALAHVFSKRRPDSAPLRIIPHAYQWAAAFLTLMWVMIHVTEPFRFILLTLLFAVSLIATLYGAGYTFAPGAMLAAAGLATWFFGPRAAGAELQNLAAIIIFAASQVALRKKSEKFPLQESAHYLWIAITAGAIWLFVSRWVIVHSSGAHFYLTASWAILAFALFGLGFALRERTYRWAALTVLACALARVVMLDVWKLETVYRILSFLALGIVLLALGYFYTRFQEKIAKWL